MDRDTRQHEVFTWTQETFGAAATTPFERALRVVEEAIELAQVEGVSAEQIGRIVTHVLSRPVGKPIQEAGGLGLCLLAYCAAREFSADTAERLEFDRVKTIDPRYFRARHNKKADVGIGVHVGEAAAPRKTET